MVAGVFIRFYGIDFIDFEWSRFYAMVEAIPEVEEWFRPKEPHELALMKRDQEIDDWRREHPDA